MLVVGGFSLVLVRTGVVERLLLEGNAIQTCDRSTYRFLWTYCSVVLGQQNRLFVLFTRSMSES